MKKNVLALVILIGIASPALADNSGTFYVAGDVGKMIYSNSNPGGADFSNPNAIRVSGGYHFSPLFAVEGGYALVGESTLNSSSGNATIKHSAVQIAAIGTYPVNASFELIGKLGASLNSIKASGTGSFSGLNADHSPSFSSIIGVGIQYNVSRQIGIRAQYERLASFTVSNNGQSWNVRKSLPSVGIVYQF